jgi:Pyruvate/2-oxoacid:ferredoxin oxidoreductase delta subunit
MTNGTARTTIALTIDEDRCLVCDDCVAKQQCRGSAIRIIDRGEAPFLDMSRCWGCMVCVYVCLGGAVVRQETAS